jgi:hypothetical protein
MTTQETEKLAARMTTTRAAGVGWTAEAYVGGWVYVKKPRPSS